MDRVNQSVPPRGAKALNVANSILAVLAVGAIVWAWFAGMALGADAGRLVHGEVLGEPVDHLVLEPIPEQVLDFGPRLIGGQPATAGEFPGVFYTTQGSSRCTGTLIGNRVVASAAHCMSNGGRLSLSYKGVTYSGTCDHAPQYRGNSTADWALCLLSSPIPDAVAESVNTDGSRLSRGKSLVIMGFGCIRPGGGGGNDGTLRVGAAPITSLPSGTDYDIVTSGSSALCYGDSGGPSFVVEGGKRYQTGINSRGNIRSVSYLSALHVSPAVDFYRTWSQQKGVKICGIHGDAPGCRDAGPGPSPDPDPPSCDGELSESLDAHHAAGEALEQLRSCLRS